MDTLLVNEMFGPTVQGEGPSTGRQCVFLRLAGCNLHCVWCDTAYTWRWNDAHPHNDNIVYDKAKEAHKLSFEAVQEGLLELLGSDDYGHAQEAEPMLVVSGGEPMLQAEALYQYLVWDAVNTSGGWPRLEIETAGTLWHEGLGSMENIWFNVSPKLANSGNDWHARFRPDVLDKFAMSGHAIFKFVVTRYRDFEDIEGILAKTMIRRRQVYIMPEGATRERFVVTQQACAEEAIKRGFNLTSRLHILLWDKKRAV